MKEQLRVLAAGVQFLTRIPIPASLGHEPDDLARSTVYFPIIGLIVGAFSAAVYWGAAMAWPPFVAAALAIAGTIWLTGAFHEDALADACDGFGGGWHRDQILAIMKDSRIGSYGAVAVVMAIVLKVGALTALSPVETTRALLTGHVVARWSSLPLIWWLPYARETPATGKPFAASVTSVRLAIGTAVTVVIATLLLGLRAPPVLLIALLITIVSGVYFRRRIGGITGDCLGAANQFVEVAVYLTLSCRMVG